MASKRQLFEKCFFDTVSKIGYKKSTILSATSYICPINGNISKTISFGFTSFLKPGHLLIQPYIGVCLNQIDRLLYDLLECSNRFKYKPSETISSPIWKYMDDGHFHFQEWDMDDSSQSQIIVDDILSKIEEYGSAFYGPFGDGNLDNVAEYLINDSKACSGGKRDWIIPAVYYLLGEKQKGWKYIENRIDESPKAYCDILDKVYLKNYLALP